MGYDVLRQAEEIVERTVLSREFAEQNIAERIAEQLAAGRSWRCRACDAYLITELWARPASGLCAWCSPVA